MAGPAFENPQLPLTPLSLQIPLYKAQKSLLAWERPGREGFPLPYGKHCWSTFVSSPTLGKAKTPTMARGPIDTDNTKKKGKILLPHRVWHGANAQGKLTLNFVLLFKGL